MPESLIIGNNNANTRAGGSGDDLIYGYNPDGQQGNAVSISANRVAAGLDAPLFAVSPPGDLGRLFIVEKAGAIKILDLATGEVLAQPFLDLRGQILADGERGLLGLAFHPDYAQNGWFYVNLIRPDGDTEIRRYQVSAADPDRADAGSAETVIQIDQPDFSNHKAGWLDFGPDGHLYAALGDGGGGGDPDNHAQNGDSLLGKMLRLDVDGDDFADAARNYAIPADNPFVGTAGADEIWALGLRNPWRPGFDRGLGELYIADVGQGAWEEVNLGAAGANYGWRTYEGSFPFSPGTPLGGGTLTGPIHSYNHEFSGRSITGGYVYRGSAEGLHGDYFFADFITGQVFTLELDGGEWVAIERTGQIRPDAGSVNNPASFGQDGAGNLYLVDIDGDIFRLTPNAPSGDAADTLRGLGGDDMLFGGSGNDTLEGGDGNDELQGGAGADRLAGGNGDDRLVGSAGNDVLRGGAGTDSLDAGDGADLLTWGAGGFFNGGPGADRLKLATGDLDLRSVDQSAIRNIERIDLRGPDSSTLTLTRRDVLDLSSTTNTLTVPGDVTDTVDLRGSFAEGTTSGGYTIWQNGPAIVRIDERIDVI
jgi:glucose/arabinose dehydrogenase